MEILDKVNSSLPKEVISRVELEGSEIIVYTKSKDFFRSHESTIKEIVSNIKKRIEVRPESNLTTEQETTKAKIKEIVPEDAKIRDIYFEPERSLVIIAAEKPGLVIGRGGETFRHIRSETLWVPRIERVPSIKSEIIEGIRKVLHKEVKFRKKFLNNIGKSIFTERKTNRDWIRIIALGGFREVGRSCMLVETPKSKVLVDCGVKLGGTNSGMYPILQTKEFDPNEIDAVIVSHAHLDHCLHPDSYIQLSDGNILKIPEVRNNENILSADFQNNLKLDEMNALQRGGIKSPEKLLEIRTKTKRIRVTDEHPFFCIENGAIKTKFAKDLRKNDFIASVKEIKIEGSKQSLPNKRNFPSELDPLTAQIIGYILGDGCKTSKNYNSVVCTDKNLNNLKNYQNLIRKKFELNPRITQKARKRLHVHSADFRRWLEEIDIGILAKSKQRRIPAQVCRSKVDVIAGFLRGLFDAEGSVKHHSVVLSSSSEDLIFMTQLLLLRLGIISHVYDVDESKSTFGGKNAFQLTIYDPQSLKKFFVKIKFDDKTKMKKLKNLIPKIGHGVGSKIDLLPIRSKYILSICKKLGLRKIDLRKLGFHYTHYYKNHFPSRQKISEITNKLLKIAKRKKIKIEELDYLKKLTQSKLMWEPITKINRINSDTNEVFDLTVAGHSNYIANGIVVHNCGMVPYLYEYGYKGPLYCTTPTVDLFALLCLDYIDVMQRNGVNPLYTAKSVKEAVKRSIPLEYGEVSDVAPDVRLTLQNAGHIMGSALIHLHIGEGMHNIVWASDMKYARTTLFEPAFTDFQRLETLIIESTYGGADNIMPHRQEAESQLMEIIGKTMARGGTVVIPTFAVERSQDVMAILVQNDFQYPVFVDGMIWDATGIFTAYPEYMSHTIQKKIFNNQDPFTNNIFKRIASQSEREKSWEEKPAVILSTSGMLVGGPVMEHLKALAEDEKNTLIFISYQAEGTMGKRIQKGWKEIPARLENGKTATIKLNMEVRSVEGLSGHSDRNQLLSFVNRLSSRPNRVLVCHGNPQKTVDLARSIYKLFKIETGAPKNLEAIRLR